MSSTAPPGPGVSPGDQPRSDRVEPDSNRDQTRDQAARKLAGVYPQHEVLARLKQFLDSDTEDPGVLTEMAACAYRLQSNLEGIQAEILQRLQRAHPSSDLGEELAARLSLTTAGADRLLSRAAALDDYREVHFALLAADIDVRKAEAFIDSTKTLPTAEARAIHRTLLPDAPDLTTGQLRHRLRAAALAVDAELAQERHQEAAKDRSVVLAPADDEMAFLTFYLPATEAVAAMTTLDALAVKDGPDDERSVGARRADAFTDLIHQAMATGRTPDGTSVPTQHRKRPHLVITVAQSTLDGEDNAPGYLAGYGPLSAEVVRELARSVEPPGDSDAGATDPPGDSDTGAIAPAVVGRDASGRGAEPSTHQSIAPGTPTRTVATDPYTGTLLPGAAIPAGPLACEPADPLSLALRLSHRADPVSALRDVGILATDAYQPGATLRDYVLSRDVTCRFPTCRQPARRCQIDHIIAFDTDRPAWAQTHQGNLHLLCQRHHQLKTAGVWSLTRDHLNGDTHWTSPLGYRYTRQAEIIDPTHHLPLLHQTLDDIRTEHADEPDRIGSLAPVQPGLVSEPELAELLCRRPDHTSLGQCTCAEQAATIEGIRQRVGAAVPPPSRVSPSTSDPPPDGTSGPPPAGTSDPPPHGNSDPLPAETPGPPPDETRDPPPCVAQDPPPY